MVIPGYECITEYDEANHMEQIAGEIARYAQENFKKGFKKGFREGFKRGLKKGKLLALAEVVKDGLLSVSEAAEFANMTVPEFEAETAKLLSERESI